MNGKDRKTFTEKLADILVELEIIKPDDAKAIKKDFYDRSKANFDYFLLNEGLVSKENLLLALSEYYQVPSFDVRGHFFDHTLLTNFPKTFLLENVVVPLQTDQDDFLVVVANEPDTPGLQSKIREYTTYEVEFRVGIARDIIDIIREYYDESPTYIHDTTDEDEVEPDETLDQGIDMDDYFEDKDRW